MYDMKGFGERIAALRKNKNMTQDELAQRLGVTSQAVSKWENNLSYPDIEIIPSVCSILEVSLDDMFGKVKQDVNSLSFPKTYKGVNFVYAYANVACYSDKEVEKTDVSTVTFKDGSIAEISNRRIVNKGAGRILLKTIDESFVSEDSRSGILGIFKQKLTQTNVNFEYGKVGNLYCSIPNGNCFIEKSDTDITTLYAEGYPEFIDLLEFEYSDDEKTLKVQYNKRKRDELNREMEKWDNTKNNIKIMLASDSEILNDTALSIDGSGKINLDVPFKTADMKINGSGSIKASVSFDDAHAAINGSGNISVVNADKLSASINGSGNIDFNETATCGVSINGSGNIKFNKADGCTATINGSGNIGADRVENLSSSINGSGNMRFGRCGDLKAGINGSGGFNVDKVDKSVDISIHGSGNINIKEGEVRTFNIYLQNGKVNAKGVTAERAKIEIENHGTVEIGRVIVESIEKCSDHGELIIHQRG